MKNLAHTSLGLLVWLLFLLGSGLPLQAQDDDKEQRIHLRVIKEKDGVEEVYEKTYDSRDELLNDEKLKELNVDVKKFEGGLMLHKQNGKHIIFKDSGTFVFNAPYDSIFRNFKFNNDSVKWSSFDHDSLFLKVDSLVQYNLNSFMTEFNFDSMKVHLDTSFFKLKEFFSDDNFNMPYIRFFEGNGDVFQMLDSLGSDHHFNFFSPGQEEDDMKIYIRTLGDKMLTIRDVEETDKSLNSLDLNYENQLSAEALNYHPNPSDGVFTLQFKGDAEKELQVNIYDLDGKEIYREILTDFFQGITTSK